MKIVHTQLIILILNGIHLQELYEITLIIWIIVRIIILKIVLILSIKILLVWCILILTLLFN